MGQHGLGELVGFTRRSRAVGARDTAGVTLFGVMPGTGDAHTAGNAARAGGTCHPHPGEPEQPGGGAAEARRPPGPVS